LIEVQWNLKRFDKRRKETLTGSRKQELGLARWRSAVGLPEVLFDRMEEARAGVGKVEVSRRPS